MNEYLFNKTQFIVNWPSKYITYDCCKNNILTVGRIYEGIYNKLDGNFIIVQADGLQFKIIRDKFGSIPIYYSKKYNVISTDITSILALHHAVFDADGLREYLDVAYTTFGRTLFADVFVLQPNETITIGDTTFDIIEHCDYFPSMSSSFNQDDFKQAIDHSISNLISVCDQMILNLSGGNDSSLILALLKEKNFNSIYTNTYHHIDWRDDFDDWRWAAKIALQFKVPNNLTEVDNSNFSVANRNLTDASRNIYHTYATAFYLQNSQRKNDVYDDAPIINGSGPDEIIVGTEKLSINEILSMKNLSHQASLDYISGAKDYRKVDTNVLNKLTTIQSKDFWDTKLISAQKLIKDVDFVEFQRRFHSATVLQDHIKSLSGVASALKRGLFFPFLTSDIFDIVFQAPFEKLNEHSEYKSIIKSILKNYVAKEFVHRKKIGFQSPSRKYFMEKNGMGMALNERLKFDSNVIDISFAKNLIEKRLSSDYSQTARYDFLEWTIYNVLTLEMVHQYEH